jgi:equilibrative nucleoside transporter 1/2/3
MENIDYAADIFLIYVLTLSIFPGFLYENTGTHQLGTWYVPIYAVVGNVDQLFIKSLMLALLIFVGIQLYWLQCIMLLI